MNRIFLAFATLSLTISSIATAATPAKVSAAAAATEAIGHNAENLYDWGRQDNWTRARADLAALKSAVARVEGTASAADLQATHTRVAAMESAIQNRRPRDLMHAANEMTGVAAEMSRPFKPQVPAEVTLLDYHGRELELWAEEGNVMQLHEARMRLEESWNIARGLVIAKGGVAEARQFDALLNQLTLAETPREFAAAATPILDSVDSLETVFTRGSV